MIKHTYESPMGNILIRCSESAVVGIELQAKGKKHKGGRSPIVKKVISQLDQYFSGKRKKFTVPLDLSGTDFQLAVWKALYGVPFGMTVNYQQLAKLSGSPKAYRAVGGAMSKNPIPIIVPCHRVLAKAGLGGFSSGLKRKRYLLELEGVL